MSDQSRSIPHDTPAPADQVFDDIAVVHDDEPTATESDTVTTAREGAADTAREVRRQGRHLLEEAREQLQQQVSEQTQHVGHALQDLGQRLQALAEGRTEEAGQVGEYADELAWRIQDVADRIEDLGFEGLVEDVRAFARRRPGSFLAAAAFAGFASARVGRGVAEAGQADRDDHGSDAAPVPTGPATERPRDVAASDPVVPPPVPETGGVPVPAVPDPRDVPDAGSREVRR